MNVIGERSGGAPLKVALLTSFVAPYRVPVFERLASQLRRLRIFVSTPMEPNRDWEARFGALDVVCQRNLTIQRIWRHPTGFAETLYIQVPYDTIWRLWRERPDVIVTDEVGPRTIQAMAYRWLRPSTALVIWMRVSEHTERGKGGWREWLRGRLLPYAEIVFVHGQSAKRYIMGHGVESPRIVVAPQAVDTRQFASVP